MCGKRVMNSIKPVAVSCFFELWLKLWNILIWRLLYMNTLSWGPWKETGKRFFGISRIWWCEEDNLINPQKKKKKAWKGAFSQNNSGLIGFQPNHCCNNNDELLVNWNHMIFKRELLDSSFLLLSWNLWNGEKLGPR